MTDVPALQTSSIPSLFDVRDQDLNFLGYTKHNPDLCEGRVFQIPVNTRRRSRPLFQFPCSGTEPENEWAMGKPNWQVISLTVEYMMYKQNRFKTWVCGADDAVALVQAKWICAIGEDNLGDFIDMLRCREAERMRIGQLPEPQTLGSIGSTWQSAAVAFPRREQSAEEPLQPQPVPPITITDNDAVVTFGTRKLVIPRTQE